MQTQKLTIAVVLLLLSILAYSQNDKVYSKTGDIIIGELKSLSRGVLVFDTEYADSDFEIDWDEIDAIEISNNFLIYTADGDRFKGGLKPLLGQGRLIRLITEDAEITMRLDEIVEIVSLKKSILDRFKVSIDAGISITKEHNVRQKSIASNFNYRGDKWLVAASFNGEGTTQDGVDPIERVEGGLTMTRDIFGNTMVFGGMEFLSTTAQDLDLRSTGKLGAGYFFIRNNRVYFFGGAGLAVSNEKYGGENPSQSNNLEGLVQTELNAYNMGDFSLLAKLMAYPSITDKGRWRLNTDIILKYDFPLDFYMKLSLIHKLDNKPPDSTNKTDYSFQTSFGWEWN